MNRFLIVCLHLVLLVVWMTSNIALTQEIEIQDGGMAVLNAGSYANTITSTIQTDVSTAVLRTSGTVYLQGTLTKYYGQVYLNDASSLYYNAGSAPLNLLVGGTDYLSTTIFIKQGAAYTFSGTDGSVNTIELRKYGVIDLTNESNIGDLTISKNLYISSYNQANAGKIKFALALNENVDATKKISITTGRILTDDLTNGQIDVSKHMEIDFSKISLSGISLGMKTFTLATGSTNFYTTGAANVIGNDKGLWDDISVVTNVAGHNMKVQATFAPAFQLDATAGGGYAGTWSDLLSSATEGATQTILKNLTLTADVSLSKNLVLNFGNYNVTTGDNAFLIADGKYLGLSTTGSGVLLGNIHFSGTTSVLKILSSSILNSSFYVEASSSESGLIEIGNGSTAVSQSLIPFQLNNKVSKVTVKSKSTLTLITS